MNFYDERAYSLKEKARIERTLLGKVDMSGISIQTKKTWGNRIVQSQEIRRPSIDSIRKLMLYFKKGCQRDTGFVTKLSLMKAITEACNPSRNDNARSDFYIGSNQYNSDDAIYIKFDKKYTLDNIKQILNGKVTKTVLTAILANLDLKKSSKALIMEYVLAGKIEPYRVLGGNTTIQFTKKELNEIMDNPNFLARRIIPMSGDRTDITNRYRLLMHQDAVDDEIFFEAMSTATDPVAKKRLRHTLNTKKFKKRFKGNIEVELWLKLQ